jgi:hypothetical protein
MARPTPQQIAWRDQFGALVRDKCREIIEVVALVEWDNLAIDFVDTYDDDEWRLTYRQGHFWITNLTQDPDFAVLLNLDALGVIRR